MKWLLATLNNLNREYEFQFKHAQVNHSQIEDAVDSVLAALSEQARDENTSAVATVSSSSSSDVCNSNNKNKPSLKKLLSETLCEMCALPASAFAAEGDDEAAVVVTTTTTKKMAGMSYMPSIAPDAPPLPSDRNWESAVPLCLRERAIALRTEILDLTQTDKSNAMEAYDRRCTTNDRDICNFLGAVMAVDFRHWISESFGDEVAKLEGCWCRQRASAVLPCACEAEGKPVREPKVKQMYNRERGTGKIVRGSAAMVSKMRDIVDAMAESDENKFWFRPSVMKRRLLSSDEDDEEENDGRYELIDDLFTGCDITGEQPLQFPAAVTRVSILKQLAEFYAATGKDFYDLVVECKRHLIGDLASKEAALNTIDFTSLPGLIPSLCKHMPRFFDAAPFHRRADTTKTEEGSAAAADKFVVAHKPAAKKVARREGAPFSTRAEEHEHSAKGKAEVTVLFLKLAQLFAVALRSCRGLFASKELKWLRDDEPFLDEEEHLTICSDYQIPNALRFSDLVTYSDELAEDVDRRRLLPSQSLKEVEVRLVSVLAATHLRDRFQQRVAKRIAALRDEAAAGSSVSAVAKREIAVLGRAKEKFTVSVLDFVIWLFGRSLTSAGIGCHHLTAGVMY